MKDDFCLTKDTLNVFWELCCDLAKTNKRYRVSIREWRDKRSIPQNDTYWGWLTEIAEQQEVGGSYYDNETWHEYFKKHWCPIKIIPLPVGQSSIKSTKLLDIGEMHFYMSRIERWAMDKLIALTIPEKSEYRKLQDKQNE